MQLFVIQRIVGILLMVFSFTMIPPMIVSIIYLDGVFEPFFNAFAIILITGMVAWLPVKTFKKELRLRDGFVLAALFWIVLAAFGSIPFLLTPQLHITLTDAFFEALSGLTTTGATVMHGLDELPKSILYYRQQLQWLGGMGIIVLAVAIMPMLGIGGMQLFKSETPGPMKDSKLTPRITETAKALWYIYLSLTIACAIAYWFAGMDVFDAIGHSFSTISIGGFSTHDASMGYFDSKPAVEIVAIIFMLISGVNFSLHFLSWRSRSLTVYIKDSEFITYVLLLAIITLISSAYLYHSIHVNDPSRALLHGLFQTVSIATTAGFVTREYHHWPAFLPVLLLFTSFIGACAGSTGGGMKMIRFLLLLKQGAREIMRLIHPNSVIPIKIGGKPLSDRIVQSVWGFFSAYVASFSIVLLLLLLTGLDQVSAFSATAATMNNLGPGLKEVGSNYAVISDASKWILSFSMLLGRLEIFTLLVLFTPAFWRR